MDQIVSKVTGSCSSQGHGKWCKLSEDDSAALNGKHERLKVRSNSSTGTATTR